MKKHILSCCVIAGAMLSAPTMALESPEFIGYAKWGKMYTNSDERNNGSGEVSGVIATTGGFGNFRLGNEANWWEAGLTGDVAKISNSVFDVTWMIGNGGGDWSSIRTQQMYVGATDVIPGQPQAEVWAGRRYYRQHEAFLIDVKVWDTSDTGIGIENIDLGFANAHFAWFAPDAKFGQPTEEPDQYQAGAIHSFDFRISDINLGRGADLTLGINYATLQNRDLSPAEYNISNDGYMLTAAYNQIWSRGTNRMTLQYGVDGLAGGLMDGVGTTNKYFLGLEHEGSSLRFVDNGEVRLSNSIDMMYVLAYQKIDLDNGNGTEWASIGIQPQYAWNSFHTTAFQIGYDMAKDQTNIGKNETFKATISQQIQAGPGVWSRPAIRIYASYVEQAEEWKPASSEWFDRIPGAAASSSHIDTSEYVFGFNFEAWW